MAKIEIDGVTVEVEPGTTIIEVADRIGIPIPRFCYHRKLSVAANCRMCLVQVEKAPKALPACATPIADGMKVWTKSKDAVAAQRAVMEFLLINHPLDCPICDQGGECELQDVSMEYGRDDSRYDEPKRVVLDEDLGPLISTEMTRCIQCTRCVRFGEEVSGEKELGATGRGEYLEIRTFIAQTMNSEVSGNVIDLCPVGALTSKPYRFKARAWELSEKPSIAPHDCIGSNVFLHIYDRKVLRVVPKDTDRLNEVWLSDRDRFSYQGLVHDDRLRKPLLRKQEHWQNVPWVEALKYALAGLKLSLENFGAEQVGVLVSPCATTEEYYLLQKFARTFGCKNIDHRLRQQDFSAQEHDSAYPNLGIDFYQLEQQDTILIIGANLAKEQPLASMRIRKATLRGAKVCVINPADYSFNFALSAKSIPSAGNILASLAGVALELIKLRAVNVNEYAVEQKLFAAISPTKQEQAIAQQLHVGTKVQIILGQFVQQHPQAANIYAIANLIAKLVGGHSGYFSEGANAAGAWLTGCVPHRRLGSQAVENPGKNALEMLQTPLRCYILFATEPDFDTLLGAQALETIKQADFVIALSSYQSKSLLEIADVILPIATYAENTGSFINIDGTRQEFKAVIDPFGESRPAWKVLRVLGTLAEFAGFEYETIDELMFEVQRELQPYFLRDTGTWPCRPVAPFKTNNQFIRLAPCSLYALDGITRRATALQATQDAIAVATCQMNSKHASDLQLMHGELVSIVSSNGACKLPLQINDQVADKTVIIYQAHKDTLKLGLPYELVEVTKC